MSVAVCRSSATGFESILALPTAFSSAPWTTLAPLPVSATVDPHDDERYFQPASQLGQLDIWGSIQAQAQNQKRRQAKQDEETTKPYVHPSTRHSSSGLLSQKSLEICTESLGSETGSHDFFSSDDESDFFSPHCNYSHESQNKKKQLQEISELLQEPQQYVSHHQAGLTEHAPRVRKELVTVNYHCSITSRRSSLQPRSFPPPLPSISRRDGPCLQMRPHRRDGRLVVEAVTVPSQNYLHAERQNGRLLLSFINTTSTCTTTSSKNDDDDTLVVVKEEEEEELVLSNSQQSSEQVLMEEEIAADQEEEEEEEEVEVVDRGTVVEVKVSTQPQQSGANSTMKVHRSSIVINKFVSCIMPDHDNPQTLTTNDHHQQQQFNYDEVDHQRPQKSPPRRLSMNAAVAASSVSALSSAAADGSSHSSSTNDNKLLFTSRRRNREELLHDMRRCSQLRKPLFIWEPCCIATSS